MQEDVAEQRRDGHALGKAPIRQAIGHAGVEPFVDQGQHAPVGQILGQKILQQPMVDAVKRVHN